MVHGRVSVPTLPVAVVHRVLLCLEDAGGAKPGGVDAKARAHTAAGAATVKLMDLARCARIYAGWPGRSVWPSPEAKAGKLRALQQVWYTGKFARSPAPALQRQRRLMARYGLPIEV